MIRWRDLFGLLDLLRGHQDQLDQLRRQVLDLTERLSWVPVTVYRPYDKDGFTGTVLARFTKGSTVVQFRHPLPLSAERLIGHRIALCSNHQLVTIVTVADATTVTVSQAASRTSEQPWLP